MKSMLMGNVVGRNILSSLVYQYLNPSYYYSSVVILNLFQVGLRPMVYGIYIKQTQSIL